MTQEEKAKAYDEAIKKLRNAFYDNNSRMCEEYRKAVIRIIEPIFPELKESEDEKIRKELIKFLTVCDEADEREMQPYQKWIAWLEKQKIDKEINLVEILKHYPKETELYSPLYGKLWLAEVDEKNETITCYKHRLEEGCTRAVLEQEDTVSFYSNGTTGLPDFNVSKHCMLFLYDIEKQGEQKPAWSEEDERMVTRIVESLSAYADKLQYEGFCHNSEVLYEQIKWLKSLRPQLQWKPSDEQMETLKEACDEHWEPDGLDPLYTLYQNLKKLREEQL